MLTAVFDRLFQRLVGAFLHYQDVPRTLDRVAELGASRWDLEIARRAIARELERLGASYSSRSFAPRHIAATHDDLARLSVLMDGFTGR